MASHELRKCVAIIVDDNARNELGIGKLRLRHRGALSGAAGLQAALRTVQAGGGEPPDGVPDAPTDGPAAGAGPACGVS